MHKVSALAVGHVMRRLVAAGASRHRAFREADPAVSKVRYEVHGMSSRKVAAVRQRFVLEPKCRHWLLGALYPHHPAPGVGSDVHTGHG